MSLPWTDHNVGKPKSNPSTANTSDSNASTANTSDSNASTANTSYSNASTANTSDSNASIKAASDSKNSIASTLDSTATTTLMPEPKGPTLETFIPPLLGVAPLGSVPLTEEQLYQLKMMEAASQHMPRPEDSEFNHLEYLIQHGLDLATVKDLPPHMLFELFYHRTDPKEQDMAARGLIAQDWRFNTKHSMWLKRKQEPQVINDEYERGTFLYFDKNEWKVIEKVDFIFEYKYLLKLNENE